MMKTKIGYHLHRYPDIDLLNRIIAEKPRVVKTLDHSAEWIGRLKRESPDTFIIGRYYEPNQDVGTSTPMAMLHGRAFAGKILNLSVNNQVDRPDAWESYNERCHSDTGKDCHVLYAHFMAGFYDVMRDNGFEAIGLNSANGNLDGDMLLEYYRPMLDKYTYLGFHEYDWPTMDRLHNQGIQEGNGGMWLALRYRRMMEAVRAEYGDNHKVIVTECGMTQGVQGGADVGWRADPNVSRETYIESLAWYDGELCQDNYVMGACLYDILAPADWQTFESVDEISEFYKPDYVPPGTIENGDDTMTYIGWQENQEAAVNEHEGHTPKFTNNADDLPGDEQNVEVEQTTRENGKTYLECVLVHHLTPVQNRGGSNIFWDVLDTQGNRWSDTQPGVMHCESDNESGGSYVVGAQDKPPHELKDFSIWGDDLRWVRPLIADGSHIVSADRVKFMHGRHGDEPQPPDGQGGNTHKHHSFHICWQEKVYQGDDTTPPPNPGPGPGPTPGPGPSPSEPCEIINNVTVNVYINGELIDSENVSVTVD